MPLNSNLIAIMMVIFILLGVYSVFSGLRRIREARERGQHIRWYRQINLLTGIEYLLLSFVFMMSLNLRNNTFPAFLRPIVIPFYLIVLISSAVIAGFVIRQAIVNARQLRRNPGVQVNNHNVIMTATTHASADEESASEQQAEVIQRRRERRQKSAAARRRRAGRA